MGYRIAIWRLAKEQNAPIERVEFATSPQTIDQATRLLPGGAYTTLRTYGRFRVLPLSYHFERLEESARLSGQTILLDRSSIRRRLHAALAQYPADLARVRVTLDLEQEPGCMYILCEPLRLPSAEDYERGVRVVTRLMQRENPKAKRTDFISVAGVIREGLPEGINEVVMIGGDGQALEGLSSNFFAVQNGVVWTAEEGVLNGITRQYVLEVIRSLGIPLRLSGARLAGEPGTRVAPIDEAFLTSASRAVLPVTEIDGRRVGGGQPGPLTRQIMHGYQEKVEAELETL